jgi:hypothetical protein
MNHVTRRRAGIAAPMLLVALLLIGCGVRFTGVALADGDPASDLLIVGDVFYPYSPAVSKNLEQRLAAETAAARAAGFTIKVALVASPSDLGAATVLFGKPETYAHFLEAEIRELAPHRLLLVVMPAGYGVSSDSRAAREAVARLDKPAGNASDDLAGAAIVAVPKLAAAAGHPLRNIRDLPAPGANTSASTWKPPTIAILALGAIAIAGVIIIVRQRRARRR